MFDRECVIYGFLEGYCRDLVADVDDAQFARQPTAGVNPPAWLLGHLAVTAEMGVALLGEASDVPEVWRNDFGPGSTPRDDRSSYPPKDELLDAYGAAHGRLVRAARSADPGRLGRRHPLRFEAIRKGLPTIGDLVGHLLTSHEAMHLGHLSNWRRQMGMPYLF